MFFLGPAGRQGRGAPGISLPGEGGRSGVYGGQDLVVEGDVEFGGVLLDPVGKFVCGDGRGRVGLPFDQAVALEVHDVEAVFGLDDLDIADLASFVEEPVVERGDHVVLDDVLVFDAAVLGVLLCKSLEGVKGLLAGAVLSQHLFGLGLGKGARGFALVGVVLVVTGGRGGDQDVGDVLRLRLVPVGGRGDDRDGVGGGRGGLGLDELGVVLLYAVAEEPLVELVGVIAGRIGPGDVLLLERAVVVGVEIGVERGGGRSESGCVGRLAEVGRLGGLVVREHLGYVGEDVRLGRSELLVGRLGGVVERGGSGRVFGLELAVEAGQQLVGDGLFEGFGGDGGGEQGLGLGLGVCLVGLEPGLLFIGRLGGRGAERGGERELEGVGGVIVRLVLLYLVIDIVFCDGGLELVVNLSVVLGGQNGELQGLFDVVGGDSVAVHAGKHGVGRVAVLFGALGDGGDIVFYGLLFVVVEGDPGGAGGLTEDQILLELVSDAVHEVLVPGLVLGVELRLERLSGVYSEIRDVVAVLRQERVVLIEEVVREHGPRDFEIVRLGGGLASGEEARVDGERQEDTANDEEGDESHDQRGYAVGILFGGFPRVLVGGKNDLCGSLSSGSVTFSHFDSCLSCWGMYGSAAGGRLTAGKKDAIRTVHRSAMNGMTMGLRPVLCTSILDTALRTRSLTVSRSALRRETTASPSSQETISWTSFIRPSDSGV